MKRLIASALLALSVMFGAVAPALAYDHTNYAGRPAGDDASDGCHGIAYGRVNGELVLFMAYHCNPMFWSTNKNPGQPAFGNQNTRIGVWASDWGGASANDLSFIWLDDGQRPFIKNRIYRGYVSSTQNDFWTVNVAYPTPSLGCAQISGKFGRSIYQNWQVDQYSTTKYRTGIMYGWAHPWDGNSCSVDTNISVHVSPYKDSSSPFVYGAQTNQPAGQATYQQNGYIWFAPFYDGWLKLANAFRASGGDVWLCYNEDCT